MKLAGSSTAEMELEETAVAVKREQGFTLIEVLVVIGLMAIVFTLSAQALRTYWLNQSLHGSATTVQTQLRQLQAQVESESHPIVYGAWFNPNNSGSWGLLKFDPTAGASGTCSTTGTRTFDTGVQVSAASFPSDGGTTLCRTASGVATAQIVFFYARGDSNGGSLTLRQPALNKTQVLTVNSVTGRVDL